MPVLPTLPTKRIAEQYLATFSTLVRRIDPGTLERVVLTDYGRARYPGPSIIRIRTAPR